MAAVNVPCPTCGQINQLFFEPTGTVRAVEPYPAAAADVAANRRLN